MTILQDYASWVQLAGGTGEAVSLSAGDCLMISQQTVQVLVIHYSLFLQWARTDASIHTHDLIYVNEMTKLWLLSPTPISRPAWKL